MSRIEDDRDAAREAERIALARRAQEDRQKQRSQEESAFARVLQKAETQKVAKDRVETDARHDNERRDDDATSPEGAPLGARVAARKGRAGEVLRRGERREAELRTQGRIQDQMTDMDAVEGRAHDHESTRDLGDSRSSDARVHRESDSEWKEGQDNARLAKGGRPGGGERRVDGDERGQSRGGGDGQKKDDREQQMAQGFRMNPALMAPVPVARPKDQASAKLRALATEIAQKIVEKVYVGKNAKGQMEFHIDLRSNVLKGLSIKVSGGGGKIRALFITRDNDIVKLLEEQAEVLKGALNGKGLVLEDFRIEAR